MTNVYCLLLLLLAMCLSSCNCQEEPKWIEIEKHDLFTLSVDQNSKINVEKDVVRFWSKMEFAETVRVKEKERKNLSDETMYTLFCEEIRCNYKDIRHIGSADYGKNKEELRSENLTKEELDKKGWEPIFPDSMYSKMYEVICK
jgi:hypothetical protein